MLNEDTGNDLLTETKMSNYEYTYGTLRNEIIWSNISSIALMVFLIAYALFEVPSNYLLKKLRPSVCRPIPDKISILTDTHSAGSHS